jgi:two-component system nitrate/nitrite response regulator NarL
MTRGATAVIVADARPVVAQGLAAGLTGHPRVEAAAVSTDTELVAAIETGAPAVVLVPLDPGGAGTELLHCALRAAPASTHVVVIGAPRAVAGPLSDPWVARGIRAVLPASCSTQELAGMMAAIDVLPDAVGPSDVASPVAGLPGGDRPEPPAGALARLTPREREVLGLLAQGRSTREIADGMSISVNTVRAHVNVLLHKLGVHSRLRAVALFTDGAPPARSPGGTADGG